MNTKEKIEIDGIVYTFGEDNKASKLFKEYSNLLKEEYGKMLKEEFGVNLIVRD